MSAILPAGAGPALDLLVRATLLIGGAWASAAALRAAGASAAARHMAWLLGIAALLALPLVRWLAPSFFLPILPESAIATASAPIAAASQASAAAGAPVAQDYAGLLALAYALGSAILLLRILVARRVLARIWRESEPAADPAWDRLLSDLSLEVELKRPVELRIAPGPVMPMTWGTLAPKLLLPAEALDWTGERRRLVLLHELAHVARLDSLSRTVAALACALYWFHPGAWFAARRMGMEQEHAADDRVLIAGGSAPAYARSLLHLAAPVGAALRPAHAAGMAGLYQLERRLVSIVNPVRRDRPTLLFFAASALTAALATLFVAAAVPVAPLPETGLAGHYPSLVPDLRQEEAAQASGRSDGDGAGLEGVSLAPAAPPGRGQAGVGERPRPSTAIAPEPRPAEPARPSDPAPSIATPAPAIPAILASGAPFSLSPALPVPDRGGEQSSFRLASNEHRDAGAPEPAIQRQLVDGPPVRSNRIASLGRFHLSSTWAQPALP